MRFIQNQAQVIPLNSFLCIYSHCNEHNFLQELWQVLNHPHTIQNLSLVGKSYGAGAIKVEPKALANLPIPNDLIDSHHYINTYIKHKQTPKQLLLFL